MKLRTTSVLSAVLLCAFNVNAATIFSDDFESGLSQWTSNRSGIIVTDPLENDNALSFSLITGGGDIISIPIPDNPSGLYILSFDYLGACGNSDCGGFIGYEPGDIWVAGTGNFPKLFDLEDTGQWAHNSFSFTGPLSISLQVEDNRGVAGDIFFDNIRVEAVPLPAAAWFFGSSLLGLIGLSKRKKTA